MCVANLLQADGPTVDDFADAVPVSVAFPTPQFDTNPFYAAIGPMVGTSLGCCTYIINMHVSFCDALFQQEPNFVGFSPVGANFRENLASGAEGDDTTES